MNCNHPRSALTTRELVVLLVIAGGLMIIAFPWIFRSQVRARRLLCERRQIEVARAILRFEDFHESFPGYRNELATGQEGLPVSTGWVIPILPFLGLDNQSQEPGRWAFVQEEYGSNGARNDNRADSSASRFKPVFIPELTCPETPRRSAEQRRGWSSFVANTGMPDAPEGSPFPRDRRANGIHLDLLDAHAEHNSIAYLLAHDGSERTLLLTENTDAGNWTESGEAKVGFIWVADQVDGVPDPARQVRRINVDRGKGDGSIAFARPASFHGKGVNVVTASSASMFIRQEIDYLVFVQMMTPNDHDLVYPGSDQPVEEPFRKE